MQKKMDWILTKIKLSYILMEKEEFYNAITMIVTSASSCKIPSLYWRSILTLLVSIFYISIKFQYLQFNVIIIFDTVKFKRTLSIVDYYYWINFISMRNVPVVSAYVRNLGKSRSYVSVAIVTVLLMKHRVTVAIE